MKIFYTSLLFISLTIIGAIAEDKVCFSPGTCCEDNIIRLANESKEKIEVVIYSITNVKILNALLAAKKRGVVIKVIVDTLQSSGKKSLVKYMVNADFDIRFNTSFKIEHNKFGIFDGKFMVVGSYNWTNAATSANSENCIIVDNLTTITQYQHRFYDLWKIYETGDSLNINDSRRGKGTDRHRQRKERRSQAYISAGVGIGG